MVPRKIFQAWWRLERRAWAGRALAVACVLHWQGRGQEPSLGLHGAPAMRHALCHAPPAAPRQEKLAGTTLLVCCHGKRDSRCGVLGAQLAARLVALLEVRRAVFCGWCAASRCAWLHCAALGCIVLCCAGLRMLRFLPWSIAFSLSQF